MLLGCACPFTPHHKPHTLNLSLEQNHSSPQDDGVQAASKEDLWTRRTHEVLDICGTAMHSTPLAIQFKNACEYSEHAPSCELRIHDVRSYTTLQSNPRASSSNPNLALPLSSRLQPFASRLQP